MMLTTMPTFVGDLLDALGRASLQGGIALLLVWAACRLVPTLPPRWRVWLWRLAYAKLLVTLLWSGTLTVPVPHTVAEAPTAVVAAPLTMVQERLPVLADSPVSTSELSPAPADAAITPALTSSPTPPPVNRPAWRLIWAHLPAGLLLVWLGTVLWCGVAVMRGWRYTVRLRRECVPIDDPAIHAMLAELAQALGVRRVPAVMTHPGITSPFLLGVRRPVIVLPENVPAETDGPTLRYLLAHELAHLRHADLLWNRVTLLAEILFVFHPVLWLTRREWRLAQEMASDALAVQTTNGSRKAYGVMLVRFATSHAAPFAPGMSVGITESFKTLARRLAAMKHIGRLSKKHLAVAGALVLVVGALGLIPWSLLGIPPKNMTLVVQSSPAKNAIVNLEISANGKYLIERTPEDDIWHIWNLDTGILDNTLTEDDTGTPMHARYTAIYNQHGEREITVHPTTPVPEKTAKRITIKGRLKAVSPDQQYALTFVDGSDVAEGMTHEGHFVMWNLANGKEIWRKAGEDMNYSWTFSPRGTYCMETPRFSMTTIWNTQTGADHTIYLYLDGSKKYLDGSKHIRFAAFLQDDSRLLLGVGRVTKSGRFAEFWEWDVTTGKNTRTTPAPGLQGEAVEQATPAAVSLDGNTVYMANLGKISALSLKTGQRLHDWQPTILQSSFEYVALNADGSLAAMYVNSNSESQPHVRLWDLRDGTLKHTLQLPSQSEHSLITTSIQFSNDNSMVHLIGNSFVGRTLGLFMATWDVASGKELSRKAIPGPSPVEPNRVSLWFYCFSDDGSRVAIHYLNGTVEIRETKNWSVVRKFSKMSESMGSGDLNHDGSLLAYTSSDWMKKTGTPNALSIWDVATGKKVRQTQLDDRAQWPQWSPDGKWLINLVVLENSSAMEYIIRDATTLSKVCQFTGPGTGDLNFTDDNRHLVLHDANTGNITLWDITTGKCIRTIDLGHKANIRFFSKQMNRYLASPVIQNHVQSDRMEIRSLSLENSAVELCATLHPFTDNQWLITTPEGYYNYSSPKVAEGMLWRYKHKYYPLERFAATYHKPEEVRKALR